MRESAKNVNGSSGKPCRSAGSEVRPWLIRRHRLDSGSAESTVEGSVGCKCDRPLSEPPSAADFHEILVSVIYHGFGKNIGLL